MFFGEIETIIIIVVVVVVDDVSLVALVDVVVVAGGGGVADIKHQVDKTRRRLKNTNSEKNQGLQSIN